MPQCETSCVQTKIGECAGCNIVLIALNKIGPIHDLDQLRIVAENTALDWCPQGTMLTPLIGALRRERPSQTIW